MKFLDKLKGKAKVHPKKGGSSRKGMEKTGRTLKLIGMYIYKFRAVIVSIPVAVASIVLAFQNATRLPESVGINLLANGDYSMMVPKAAAVLTPVVITGLCIVLTICSKRTLFPWVISVFTLVLPLLIWLTNIYPA